MKDDEVAKISDDAVDSISTLLRDDSNTLKLFAANTLGRLGGRGKRALPALREALTNFKEADVPPGQVDLSPRDGTDQIKMAIEMIESNNRRDPDTLD